MQRIESNKRQHHNASSPEAVVSCQGRIPDEWKEKPAKLRHKDRDARWTVKFTKAKPREDGSSPTVDLAIPVFGYQNHISIDRGWLHPAMERDGRRRL
jgi:transposase, IS5 family